MKKIGLIGGMSWESSLEYYKIINETTKLKLGGLYSAECVMDSVNFQKIELLQHEDNWEELTNIMVDSAENLKNAGADFVVICTNTMHKMVNDIENRVGIRVLHIAEATGEKIVEKGMKNVGLLGTKFTMEGDFYKKVLKEKFDINVIIPDEDDRDMIHQVIYDELCKGIISETSKEKYKKVIERLAENGAEGVILGCTEIPLLIKQEYTNIPVFDTTTIHAISAVEFALEKN